MDVRKHIIIFLLILPVQVLLTTITGQDNFYFDLFFLLVIYYAFKMESIPLVYTASFIGLLKDLLSGGIIGLNGFSFPLSALLVRFVTSRLQIKKFYSVFLMIFSVTFVNNLIISVLAVIFSIPILHPSLLEHLYHAMGNGLLFVLIRSALMIPGRRKLYVSR